MCYKKFKNKAKIPLLPSSAVLLWDLEELDFLIK